MRLSFSSSFQPVKLSHDHQVTVSFAHTISRCGVVVLRFKIINLRTLNAFPLIFIFGLTSDWGTRGVIRTSPYSPYCNLQFDFRVSTSKLSIQSAMITFYFSMETTKIPDGKTSMDSRLRY